MGGVVTGSGSITTFVGDGNNGTIAGATYAQSIATEGLDGSDLADGSVTNAKLANVPTGTIKGRSAGGSGPPSDIGIAALRAMLDLSTVHIAGFDEAVKDTVGAMLTDSTTVDFTYDEGAGTISAQIPNNSITSAKLAFVPATQAAITAHIDDGLDAHDASAISVQPFGGLTAANVQAALMEILAAIGPTGIAGGAVPTRVAEGATYVVPVDTQVTASLPIRAEGTVRVEGALVFARTTAGTGGAQPVPTEVNAGSTYVVPAKTQALAALPINALGTVRIDGSLVFIDPGSGS